MWNAISKVMYRILAILVAIPVSGAIRRLTHTAWRAARPDNPPHNPWRRDTRFADAVAWAAIIGAGRAATRLVTTKTAAEVWRAVIGTEPPGTPKAQAENPKDPISPLPAATDRSS